MKTLNKKLIAMATLAILAVPVAYAAPVSMNTIVNNPSSPIVFDGGKIGSKQNDVTVTYSGATAARFSAISSSRINQSYDNVSNIAKTVFGVSSFNADQFQVDHAEDIMKVDPTVANFVSSVTYNYLAVHAGNYELLFDFGKAGVAAGTAFNISTSGKSVGLSNFRAYSDLAKVVNPPTTSTVPVPGAVWLFGSGLAGLAAMRRKKAAAALTA